MNEPTLQLGKLLIIAGVALIGIGLVMVFGARFSFLGLGRLPGDIAYKGKNVLFYFPIVTCMVLSVVLAGILWLLSYLSRR